MHRSDGSGTTYIFSNYLSQISPAWAATVGTGRSVHWPVGLGGDGNPGVAHDIETIPYSIGYAETSYTTDTALGYAAVANQDGNYTTPSPAAIAADAAAKPAITSTDFTIVNQPGQAAYPISGYSWVLISARQPSQTDGQALVPMLSWLTHAGQSYARPPSATSPCPPPSSNSPSPPSPASPARTASRSPAEIPQAGDCRRRPSAAPERASTVHPGLAYVGLEWQRCLASASLRGVGRDARHVTRRLTALAQFQRRNRSAKHRALTP